MSLQFDQMLKRVFCPKQAIQRGEIYIKSTWQETGLLGNDQKYKFHTHIKFSDGTLYKDTAEDFYVWVNVKPIEYPTNLVLKVIEFVLKKIFFFIQRPSHPIAFEHMPASLFKNAKEGDTISYLMDNRPVELVLKQQNHNFHTGRINFEDFFKQIHPNIREKFLYKEDIPKDCLSFGLRRVGKEAMVCIEGKPPVPATPENLNTLETYLESRIDFDDNPNIVRSDLSFANAVGVLENEVNFLIDRNYFFFGATRHHSMNLLKRCSEPIEATKTYSFYTEKEIDPLNFKLELMNGAALFKLAYKV